MKISLAVFSLLAGLAHGAPQQLYYYVRPTPVLYYPANQCTGILGCLGQAINDVNQGIVTGAQGIIQGGAAAGQGIASGVAAGVGGVASGIGTGIGGIASGTGQAIGGVASGIGTGIGGIASGGNSSSSRKVCVKTGPYSYYCYYTRAN